MKASKSHFNRKVCERNFDIKLNETWPRNFFITVKVSLKATEFHWHESVLDYIIWHSCNAHICMFAWVNDQVMSTKLN